MSFWAYKKESSYKFQLSLSFYDYKNIHLTVSIHCSLENVQLLFLPSLTYCIPSICRYCKHSKVFFFFKGLSASTKAFDKKYLWWTILNSWIFPEKFKLSEKNWENYWSRNFENQCFLFLELIFMFAKNCRMGRGTWYILNELSSSILKEWISN